jgi:hypothetical protein
MADAEPILQNGSYAHAARSGRHGRVGVAPVGGAATTAEPDA